MHKYRVDLYKRKIDVFVRFLQFYSAFNGKISPLLLTIVKIKSGKGLQVMWFENSWNSECDLKVVLV